MGVKPGRDPDHLGGGGHLEVERHEQLALEALHVLVPDMPPVLPQVGRDAVGARQNGEVRRPDWVRVRAAPGVPHGRDVVNVDAEAKRRSFHVPVLAYDSSLASSFAVHPKPKLASVYAVELRKWFSYLNSNNIIS